MLKDKSVNVLRPPIQLDECEKSYMPGTARYVIVGNENYEHVYRTPVKLGKESLPLSSASNSVEPEVMLEEFKNICKEIPGPNLEGVKFPYADAIAKTLQEIEPDIRENFNSLGLPSTSAEIVLHTFVKDGSDGMGDVEIYRGKGERTLPGNAFQASFAVVKSEVEIDDKQMVVFEQENPNPVKCNRPLIQAIADENCESTLNYCLLPMEAEKEIMQNKIMKIDCGEYWVCHYLVFLSSMVDEKMDRSAGGLQWAGSGYPCTLCDCTREEALSKLGSFSINRKRDEIIKQAEFRRLNLEMISKNAMNAKCKGVKQFPILCSEPVDRGIDATHANINLASFFNKLLVRETAEIKQWEKTVEVKSSLDTAEKQLDDHLKAKLGINPSLMLAGNYARAFFDESNEEALLYLIPKDERRQYYSEILSKFRFLKMMYCAKYPRVDLKNEIQNVKRVGVELGQLLIDHFEYATWPNYLHKVIEHSQELLEREDGPGFIGCISGEGNEAGNKLFRQIPKAFVP
ncbi:V(D)J recombination-activating protein 1-like [Ptychodera flava]|uniref:V(D)J recombination-activating protein 1-like n=1 Tax=Ptychodera flava TaxID=63121 RepID=UPI00396A1138